MRYRASGSVISLAILAVLVTGAVSVHSTVVESRNLAELTDLAERIFVGKVVSLTDDIGPNNLPYTTITFEISRSIKGGLTAGANFSYQQFGLLQPRQVEGNETRLMVALLDGMPKYQLGEEAMVFLYQAAPLTGLCTTVGLAQGKLTIEDGQISNVLDNDRLFTGMAIDVSRLSLAEARMLGQESGPVDADTFINLVSRGVNDDLFNEDN